MNKRILVFRRQLQELQEQDTKNNIDSTVSIDFHRDRTDTMHLTGFPQFLEAIHELEPNAEEWRWSENAIRKACEQIGMSRKSIILKDESKEEIIIQINNNRR